MFDLIDADGGAVRRCSRLWIEWCCVQTARLLEQSCLRRLGTGLGRHAQVA